MPLTRYRGWVPEGEERVMMTGHQYADGTPPTPGSGIGMGLNQNVAGQDGAEKKGAKTEDVVYRIAALTAAIALLATFF
jgi:cation transport regulator ChaC